MKEFFYLLMLMHLCPKDWKEQLERKNKKVYEDNGRGGTQDNGRFWKFQRFSRNEFLKNIGCLLSAISFGLGG